MEKYILVQYDNCSACLPAVFPLNQDYFLRISYSMVFCLLCFTTTYNVTHASFNHVFINNTTMHFNNSNLLVGVFHNTYELKVIIGDDLAQKADEQIIYFVVHDSLKDNSGGESSMINTSTLTILIKRKTIAHASTFGKPFKSQLDRLDAKRYYKELLKKLCCEFEARAKNLHKSLSLGLQHKHNAECGPCLKCCACCCTVGLNELKTSLGGSLQSLSSSYNNVIVIVSGDG
uniref:Uncharacterized protein n=1 Tax=Glossina pallidipes TaxID=7398 RepID=A0A1A9ZNB3_GLOPL